MKKIWVKVIPWDKTMATTAIENGADGIMVDSGFSEKVKELSRIPTIAEDGEVKLGEDVVYFKIESGEDEDRVLEMSKNRRVIVQCDDWRIIPLENLIAKGADVIVEASGVDDALTAFGILEKGVSHILYNPVDAKDLKNALKRLKMEQEQFVLEEAKILEIRPVGMGDRVCVDTCTTMTEGEGMLVGNSSGAMFLIHSESVSNPYVSPRPFRVNAGPVHAYTKVPGGKTRYLSELAAGDSVMVVDFTGRAQNATVGRIKIEKRPLMLVTATCNNKTITTIVQNAETIRLTRSDGKPVSVVNLNPGDKVLTAWEEGGRHFGMKIDETIMET